MRSLAREVQHGKAEQSYSAGTVSCVYILQVFTRRCLCECVRNVPGGAQCRTLPHTAPPLLRISHYVVDWYTVLRHFVSTILPHNARPVSCRSQVIRD